MRVRLYLLKSLALIALTALFFLCGPRYGVAVCSQGLHGLAGDSSRNGTHLEVREQGPSRNTSVLARRIFSFERQIEHVAALRGKSNNDAGPMNGD